MYYDFKPAASLLKPSTDRGEKSKHNYGKVNEKELYYQKQFKQIFTSL